MSSEFEASTRVRIRTSGWQVPACAVGTEGVVDHETRPSNNIVALDQSDRALGPVEIFTSESGMIVEGSPTAVSAFVDQMLYATKEVGGRSRHFVADGVQIGANIAAFRQTHREYFEFSDRAHRLLKEHGAIPTKDGNFFRSMVHDGKNLAGNRTGNRSTSALSRP